MIRTDETMKTYAIRRCMWTLEMMEEFDTFWTLVMAGDKKTCAILEMMLKNGEHLGGN